MMLVGGQVYTQKMGLAMSQRQAVTRVKARAYAVPTERRSPGSSMNWSS